MIDEHSLTHPALRSTAATLDAQLPPRPTSRTLAPRTLATVLSGVLAVGAAVWAAVEVSGAIAWVAAGVVVAWSCATGVLAVRRPHARAAAIAVTVPASVAVLLAAIAFDGRGVALAVSIGLVVLAVGAFVTSSPDGTWSVPAQRSGFAAVAVVAGCLAIALAVAAPDLPGWPIWVGGALAGIVACTAAWTACGSLGTIERARLQWTGWGITVSLVLATASAGLHAITGSPDPIEPVVVAAAAAAAVGVAATGFERSLGAIAGLLVHTVVVVGLIAFVSAVYLVVVVGLSGRPDESERTVLALSIVAALVVAISGLPAQRRLHAMASRRVHGDDEEPEQALDKFTTRMSRAIPMDELLLQLVESIQKSMKTTSAEVWTGADGGYELTVSVPHRDRRRIELGPESLSVATRAHVQGNAWLAVWIPELLADRDDHAVRFTSVSHLGELLGFIITERPADQTSLDEDDEHRVLIDIARQLGLALHNVRLDNALQASLVDLRATNDELIASRARIVAATDESRRRIERDLHDGAQQHLVALAVKVGLIRQLLDADPAVATTMLEELRDDVQATLTELRELAHGIYPPRLRDRGLADALTAAAGRSSLPTTVVTDDLGRYGPDIETAVYFCCLEAIQNAGKHAGPDATIDVQVRELDGALEFVVTDDGHGFDTTATDASHGFVNMRDRIGAFAGSLDVASEPGGGTTIRGRIPLP